MPEILKLQHLKPIASGRTVEQLADLLPMRDLVLTDGQREQLDGARAG